MDGKKGRLEEFWEKLAKPEEVREYLEENPTRFFIPSEPFNQVYKINSDSVDRFEESVNGLQERALVYSFQVEERNIYKLSKIIHRNILPPEIKYSCFESSKEQIQIKDLEGEVHKLSSWWNPDEEILKGEMDSWILNTNNFFDHGNGEVLGFIEYINPETKLKPNPKFNGSW